MSSHTYVAATDPPCDNAVMVSKDQIGQRIRARRAALNLTQADVARALGIKPSAVGQWEIGRTRPSAEILSGLTSVLQMSIDKLMSDNSNALPEFTTPASVHTSYAELPTDVPVMGTTQGGAGDADFSMNGGIVDYVRRPPGISQNRQAYALFVHGDSMVPWRQPGGLVYINPQRPPAPGDHVVVEFKPFAPEEPAPCRIKKLVRRTATHLILAQYNPPEEFKVPAASVRAVHRVIEWEELLQV